MADGKVKAGIIGATGYAGVELCRLLARHPAAELAALSSESFLGEQIEAVYPNLLDSVCARLGTPDEVIERSECVFASLPHGLSQQIAAKCDRAGKAFIDLGADFRLDSEDDYRQWYGGEYEDRDLHRRAVYGLCELFRDEIRAARVIGNPGCYPTSVALAARPRSETRAASHRTCDYRFQVRRDRRGPGPDPGFAFPGGERGVFRIQDRAAPAYA